MADYSTILDPTLGSRADVEPALAERSLPARPLRVGLLDNGKANAEPLLREIARALAARHDIGAVEVFTKPDAGLTVDRREIEGIGATCDVVLTAMGDCGSCSAATVADGILLERAGLPTVSICTEPFRASGDVMARLHGFPGYEYVATPHPVASLSLEELHARVEPMLDQLQRILGLAAGDRVGLGS